jgi:very-short-patch-repair endonuclease
MKGQTNLGILRQRLQRGQRKNPTDAERKLWGALRERQMAGHKFRRQHPFESYILDFVGLEARVVIEVDRGQHATGSIAKRDAQRTQLLAHAGFQVLRFWDNQVLNEFESVKEAIWNALERNPPPSLPSP